MAELFYWRYRLQLAGGGNLNAVTPGGEVEGALLRDRNGGHACLQPWPSLGHGDLAGALRLLRAGGDSALLSQCRRCLQLDGRARAAGIGVFDDKFVPRSHLSVPDHAEIPWLEEKFSAGYEIFKLKGGRNFRSVAQRMRALAARFGARLRLRVDFNECLDLVALREFVSLLGGVVEQVDFIEDPLPYDVEVWSELSVSLPVDLAVDRACADATQGFAVRVVKPAWNRSPPAGAGGVVFTSAMDHPLGQLFAAHEAAIYAGEAEDCGLLTHCLFERDAFSDLMGIEDRRLVPPGGVGLGFGELLDRLSWRAL